MSLKNIEPDKLKSWKELNYQAKEAKKKSILNLFENDKNRFENFSIHLNNILIDFSKNLIDDKILKTLIKLAKECQLDSAIDKLFEGDKINKTQNDAVMHTYLRDIENIFSKKSNNKPYCEILGVLNKMKSLTKSVLSGAWRGYTNKEITDIVAIGIGGSDLGNKMFCKALKKKKKSLNFHFVSNIDSDDIYNVLKSISPETSLFIISSKTFTTTETLTNFNTAKEWFLSLSGNNKANLSKHFLGITSKKEVAIKHGILEENIFEFWSWVGGRYSIWSSIGLATCLYIGYEEFIDLLKGANEIDIHFKSTTFEKNIPIILALISIWNINFFDCKAEVILPYDNKLTLIVDYLQQMSMESNGKSRNRDGENLSYNTCPVIWGGSGINGQHSFFQLLHQGTTIIPSDFIISLSEDNNLNEHKLNLLANFFAQTRSLAMGKNKSIDNTKSKIDFSSFFRKFEGDRPSNTIILEKITPKSLGSLIAIYEHKVFVQGVIWNIFSYDQWGVELGKEVAKDILKELKTNNKTKKYDSSTNGLINFYKSLLNNKKYFDS